MEQKNRVKQIKNLNMTKTFIFLTMMGASIIFLLILPLGHDLWYHLYRIGAMAVELKNKGFSIPIRILSDTFNGYGYGAPLYYGDFFLYLPAFFVSLGIDIIWVYKVFIIGIWWGAYAIAYYSASLIDRESKYVHFFAYIYTFSASFALNLCIRSAIGEALAMLFLPLVFASFYCILYKEKQRNKYLFLLAIGMSAIAVSHMISLLLSSTILFIWSIIDYKRVIREGKWFDIAKAAILTILITASFIFPMLEQMAFQNVQTPTNSEYQKIGFMDYGIEWIDYFIPFELKKVLNIFFGFKWNIEFWHPGTIGLFALLLIACKKVFKVKLLYKEKIIYYLSLSMLAALGIPSIMNIVKEFFSFVQFSWRILPFIYIGLCITAYNMLCRTKNRKMEKLIYFSCFIFFICAIGPRYMYQVYIQYNNYQHIREDRPDYYEKYQYKYSKNAADSLYLPKGVSGQLYLERKDSINSNYTEIEYEWERINDGILIDIKDNPYNDLILELPLFMYKGYMAENIETCEEVSVTKSMNGLVNVNIGSMTGKIHVYYGGTLCQKISDFITTITIIVIALIMILKRYNYRFRMVIRKGKS